jgi:CheY-like chemotaxis protein
MNINSDVTILVVDDNKENLSVVGNIFKDMGYKLAFALGGKDALEILETTPVTLILLDIMMPGMDGFEVCYTLKENPKTKDIPIIFLTAKTETEDIVTAFLIGGVDYVTKPFRKEELICRVNNHIELIKARATIQKQADELRKSNRFLLQSLQGLGKLLSPKKY